MWKGLRSLVLLLLLLGVEVTVQDEPSGSMMGRILDSWKSFRDDDG